MKNVLVIYYTQSGQLGDIAKTIAKPLQQHAAIKVTFLELEMAQPYPFPWDKASFFGVFPESFQQVPAAIKPVPAEILATKYDLVLLHSQVWFLSPSIPINSFLRSPDAAKLLNNTPVVTISGSRNMWVLTQEKIKALLAKNNAKLKGNIALIDKAANLVSVITIVDWMFSGVKKKYLGFFPLPGVSAEDIAGSEKFGETITTCLVDNTLDGLQPKLVAQGAIKISSYLVTVDKTANKIFGKWSSFIIKKQSSRAAWLKVFNIYLFLAIWLISPIVYILHIFTYPLKINKIKKEKLYYLGVA